MGRVERAIRFVRGSFFAGRRWRDLDDLNAQALEWCMARATSRSRARDDERSVGEAFEEEGALLLRLPATPFPAEHVTEGRIGKTPYVRFDTNDYSVPLEHVYGVVTIAASETRVRILNGGEEICAHTRSYDKGARVEDPEHVAALGDLKRTARKGRVKDRLVRAAPASVEIFSELARRGASMGAASKALLRLLDSYGAEQLDAAMREALGRDTPEPHSIKLILDRRQLDAGLKPRMPVQLPDDPRVRDLAVRPATLEQYGSLRETEDGEPEESGPATKEDGNAHS
jgi:hypothetical protein